MKNIRVLNTTYHAFIFTIATLSLILLPTHYLQQEIEAASSPVHIEIKKGEQSGYTNEIPLYITVSSSIPTNKFQIIVNTPDAFENIDDPNYFARIEKDIDYTLTHHIKPLKPGDHEVFVEAQIWNEDANYKTVESVRLNINDKLELEPVSKTFKEQQKKKATKAYFILIAIFLALISVMGIIIWKFQVWLNLEDRPSTTHSQVE